MNPATRLLLPPLLLTLKAYRLLLSPWLGCNCRFEPSCACYAEQALMLHGPVRGGALALKRLLSCHPFARAGFDPVPPKAAS